MGELAEIAKERFLGRVEPLRQIARLIQQGRLQMNSDEVIRHVVQARDSYEDFVSLAGDRSQIETMQSGRDYHNALSMINKHYNLQL